MAYSLSDGDVIQLTDFASELEQGADPSRGGSPGLDHGAEDDEDALLSARTCHQQLVEGKVGFWDLVHAPYLERDLNRQQVKAIISLGLQKTHGNYRKLATLYQMEDEDYHKCMDFLRHHDLKPD